MEYELIHGTSSTDNKNSKYETLLSVGDIVFAKVNEIECSETKNFIAINKFLPEGLPKNYGHKVFPEMHSYALLKNVKDKIYIIYTPRIGTVKKIKNSTGIVRYDVLWEERNEKNWEKGLGRHNCLEEYFQDNLIPMKNIDSFLSEKQFIQYCEMYLDNKL